MCQTYSISERRACLVLGYHRRTVRYQHIIRDDEDELTNQIIQLATRYGRYGVRRITAMLNTIGFEVNHKRVERIWKENGLKVPNKQPKRSRLWLNDGSCIRLRPEYRNHVWSYDFVTDQLINQKRIRWLNIIMNIPEFVSSANQESTGLIMTLWKLGGLFYPSWDSHPHAQR